MKRYICYYKKPKKENKLILGTKYISAYSEGEARIKILNKLPKGCIVDTVLEVDKNGVIKK